MACWRFCSWFHTANEYVSKNANRSLFSKAVRTVSRASGKFSIHNYNVFAIFVSYHADYSMIFKALRTTVHRTTSDIHALIIKHHYRSSTASGVSRFRRQRGESEAWSAETRGRKGREQRMGFLNRGQRAPPHKQRGLGLPQRGSGALIAWRFSYIQITFYGTSIFLLVFSLISGVGFNPMSLSSTISEIKWDIGRKSEESVYGYV